MLTGGHFTHDRDVTPQQRAETPTGWAQFRIAHLGEDANTSVVLDTSSTGLGFRGGTGSCVIDDYVTRHGSTHYGEIACLVAGSHGSSIIVAATTSAWWTAFHTLMEKAVEAYATD